MPIDPKSVQWDPIDPAAVKWDEPAKPQPMSRSEKFGQGLRDSIDGGAQLLTHVLPDGVVSAGNALNNWLADKTGLVGALPPGGVDEQIRRRSDAYKNAREAAGETGFDGWRLAGNVMSPANLAIAAGLPTPATLGGQMLAGGAGGAIASMLSPVEGGDFASQKAKQVGAGAALGAAAPVVAAGIGRIIKPNASNNANLQLMRSEGVHPTVGQTLGGRWNALEEKMQSLPIMGDAIANARGRALKEFNEAAINRSVAPIGKQVDGVGQRAVAEAGDMLGQAYDDAIGSLKYVKLDQKFAQDVKQLRGMAQSLTPPMRSKFNTILDDVVGGRASATGTMLGQTVKKVDSELGQQAARFGKSSVASEQELGDALKQLQSLLRQQVTRSSPEAAKAMRAADEGWANLVRIEGAAKAGKNAEGVFTPAQLNAAIQTADSSVRKRAVSRGEALMQDLASAGQSVLGNKVPNSFTADRLLIAGGGLGAGMVNPAIPAGLLGGAALYTSPAQSLLTGALTRRPESAQAVAELLKKSSPMLGPAGGLLSLQYMNN